MALISIEKLSGYGSATLWRIGSVVMSATLLAVVTALGKVAIAVVVVFIALRLLGQWLRGLVGKTKSDMDDRLLGAVLKTVGPVGCFVAILWGWRSLVEDLTSLKSGSLVDRVAEGTVEFLIVVFIVRLLNQVLPLLLHRSLVRLGYSRHLAVFRGLDSLIRSLLWILGLLVFLQNQGVEMGAIYASLAGAGIGIGLALRGPISNLLDYLTILLDEPFRIGQFICFDTVLGTVEKVGIRSTHLRSLDGERIVISNEELLTKTIRNFGDLPKRRIATTIGLRYQTPVQTVRAIPNLIESVIRQHPPAQFDRCHFTRFANSALEFEFVYLVPDDDFVVYLNLQQQINIGIMEVFRDQGIEFAYPTQTLFLEERSGHASAATTS